MSTTLPRTLVIGGGIGGLTAAAALSKRGVDVRVVEQAAKFETVGAGITIQANANAVLQALEIELPDEDVVPIGSVELVDARGRALVQGDPDEILPEPPSINIHRADLHRALLAACEGVPLEPGTRVDRIASEQGGAEVAFADGRHERFDLVIGADGIHSAVRHSLTGEGAADTRYSGQTCWRFALEAPDLVPDVTTERWIPGRRIGIIPLAKGRIYVYLVENAPRGSAAPGSATANTLRARFGGADARLDPILERLDDSIRIDHSDLCERTNIHYGRGHTLLIGDAAHAMTPNLGQGAGTAIEDVAALMLSLAEHAPDPTGLPNAVAAIQQARVTTVQQTAWRVGQVAHWKNRPARFLRDALMRALPNSLASRQTRQLWQPGIDLATRLRTTQR